MSLERAKAHLARFGMDRRILEFSQSSATVELAALAVGCEPARIAKTLGFLLGDSPILILAAGDAKIDNKKYKDRFGAKAKMIPFEELEARTGHAMGGVCPFGIEAGIAVYLDVSLKRFATVFPACGSDNSAAEMSFEELLEVSGAQDVVDVCKDWQESPPAALEAR